MPPWLQFVANHKIILWLLLVAGGVCLLNSTIFFSRLSQGMTRFIESPLFKKAAAKDPFMNRMLPFFNAVNGKPWARTAGIIQGIVFVLVGLVGLIFL